MRVAAFEAFPSEEKKRIAVQKAVNQWKKELSGGHAPRVYCLTNYTLNGIESFLSYHLLKKKIRPEIEFSDYNVVVQTLLDNDSRLYTWTPDFVLLSLDLRVLVKDFHLNAWDAEATSAELLDILKLIIDKVRAPVLVTNFIMPLIDDRRAAASLENKVRLLNQKLAEFVDQHGNKFFLLDMNRIVGLLGVQESIDSMLWYQSKGPFRSPFLSWLSRDISTIIGAHYGKSKKCVILDCDNTLWGGVIGEDGLTGIALDVNEYPGIAFYEFQSYLMNLHAQGILLAICSKNNEADVLQVFDEHPHCLLKKEHFSCIRANWEDKPDNIAVIADTLQLGLNNFVFIDDSNVECSLIEQRLPELDIIQAPQDPRKFQYIWQAENIFFVPHRTHEDSQKPQQYKDSENRRASATGFTNMGDFLFSLETRVEVFKDEPTHVERIAQLTQKTNQFNARTVRYTLQDIERFIISPKHLVFSMQVRDKFGDLGITNVCIMDLDGSGSAFIDSFLMSCRAIKRDLEIFFFCYCVEVLRNDYGINTIKAEFIPSAKNMLVEKFWEELGLQLLFTDSDNNKKYEGDIGQLLSPKLDHIQIKGQMK